MRREIRRLLEQKKNGPKIVAATEFEQSLMKIEREHQDPSEKFIAQLTYLLAYHRQSREVFGEDGAGI